MNATITSLLTLILGYIMGSWKFKSEQMWEAKNQYYQEIIEHFSEISTYSSNLSARSIPVGGTIIDRQDKEMASTIFSNITSIRKRRNIYSIFVSAKSIKSIEEYLEKALSHHFDMSEEHGMWYEGDWLAEMDFETRNWNGHHELAEDAIYKITQEAKHDLSNNPFLKIALMIKNLLRRIRELTSTTQREDP
ncbi:hypothetical protein [Halomonas nitroreducens]|uniref:Uncharacterized protein n=1 Tax=Halomonas nitroreducens TaxID=447425 RepID=A0A431UYD5_9GAMM|nr:hypothetical protein [Halomonas nitroreducens]RTQ97019.1 hypothetical protein EKG36_20385 [Halomonas nitroreducens]